MGFLLRFVNKNPFFMQFFKTKSFYIDVRLVKRLKGRLENGRINIYVSIKLSPSMEV